MRAVGIFPRLNIVCRLQSKSRKQGISAAATVCRSKWQPVWCAYSSKEHPPGAIPRRMLCRHLWRRSPRSGGGRACLLCTQVCTAARYTSVPRPNRTNARLQGPSTQVSMVPQQDGEIHRCCLLQYHPQKWGRTAPFFAASSPFYHKWQKIRHTSILAVPFWHKPCAILA